MSHDIRPEDRALLATLDALAAGGEEALAAVDPRDREGRAWAETFAALPAALDPVAPSPALRASLLAATGAERPAAGGGGADVVELTPRRRADAGRRRAPWTALLAAALAFALLGLGFLAGQVSELRASNARLRTDVALGAGDAGQVGELQVQLDTLRDRLDMVTTVARQAYPMKPSAGAEEVAATARGTVYVCGAHQQWYLNVRGLDPPPPGKEYHLWFVTPEGTVDGGVLDVGPGDAAELEAPTMPDGTDSFLVTLETPGPHAVPEGELVLVGDESIRL